MSYIQLRVHKNDINAVLEYLGKNEAVHFHKDGENHESYETASIEQIIDRIRSCARYLGITLHEQDNENNTDHDLESTLAFLEKIEALKDREMNTGAEKQKVTDTLKEAKVFSNMNVPFTELAHLSYLTLRVGRIDRPGQVQLQNALGDRAVIIPLDSKDRVLAASSRKGRFALDSELKKYNFEPITIPEGYKGIPADILSSLEEQIKSLEHTLDLIKLEKETLSRDENGKIQNLESSWINLLMVEKLKTGFSSTANTYLLSGWTPADTVKIVTGDILKISCGRAAIRVYKPEEIPEVRDGNEKVPVALKHGKFVKGFESLVFSYGAPSYGSIDPTPLVAVFFTILFGIMFGDLGQGFVLFFTGLLISKIKMFSKFYAYAVPLISVGIASMVMGLLNGAVFTNEQLLITPTRAVTAILTGQPMDRILNILPLSEKGGSVKKLFFFFGFTIGIGVILNSIGLLINITNRCIVKKYESAFFSKTGLSGLLLFWYAVFIALRVISGGSFYSYDFAGLLIPVFSIFFGPLIWRVASGKRPVLEHGLMTFFMEGFVEILETISTYISNTVSFLRVGAFALSHAVLSYIVFRFSEELSRSGAVGSASALIILIFGNAIIIVLEGMIVAIQIVRLQYYEFFNKFFTETGVEFAPFRFKKNN
jgi:V/A-type H+-transporting ATPase subunit I